MTFFKKSFIIFAILAAYMSAVVFAVKADTKRKDVCKLSKKAPGNGKQNKDGSCVTTFMGEIPDVDHMVSTLIRSPKNGQVLNENEPFTIETETINLQTGFFDDPASEYYIFPQTLNKKGFIQGHSHVTVQKLGNGVPDPRVFAFFKGLNDKAKNGILSTTVDKGLKAGNYRLCTMTSSFAHQPTLMPVAQRGSQDDCIRFTVKKRGRR